MKKTIIALISTLSIIAMATIITMTQTNTIQNQLIKENVAAMADGYDEDMEANLDGSGKCWNSITTAAGRQVLYCATCEWTPGKPTTFSLSGKCP